MATFEELDKRFNALAVERDDCVQELNNLKYQWYDAYIATDDVKNKLGKCFKVKDKDIYYKIIAPAPLKSGRAFVDVSESHWVCIITSHTGIDNYSPATLSDIVPITIETKYIPFGSNYILRMKKLLPLSLMKLWKAILENSKVLSTTKLLMEKIILKQKCFFIFN